MITKTTEDLEKELREAEETIDELRESNKELQDECDELEASVEKLNSKIHTLGLKLDEASNIENFSDSEIKSAFIEAMGITKSLNTDMKLDFIFENFDKISLEKLESIIN